MARLNLLMNWSYGPKWACLIHINIIPTAVYKKNVNTESLLRHFLNNKVAVTEGTYRINNNTKERVKKKIIMMMNYYEE